ncbi:uncharacterized protein MAM_07239 [Metarhizium album ARSEF 1941]|uniref:Uncharacterized protein n=1 Tax=Metarhizium album (strain ARSEF 1941) TaxID=1081103 RepID=A0A0B2WPA7_METAS|nr:uncharacterized protein MAM_07239 [Metarhizium album ARSEF 1941]KHN94820.1 hypothetical protein MAM_07239 [Metarhizium album ARSEF 1941]
MPATLLTNRETTPASGSLTMADYLKAQQPTLDKIRTGLAIFAVFTIVRFVLQHSYALARRRRRLPPQSASRDVSPAPAHLQYSRRQAWHLNEKATTDNMKGEHSVTRDGRGTATQTKLTTVDPNRSPEAEALAKQFISRLPPAPPLTPPQLSSAVFTIAPGRPHAVDSFMRQPNPDYMSSTSSVVPQSDAADAPTTPRRRSYQRTLPIGIPTPQQSFEAAVDSANPPLSPSSYPPTSPLLPPPPPGAAEAFGDGQAQRPVKIQGEIISVLDNEGTGWTRHTRVYGGGVCLACAASGGDDAGGFYGATVTPEEMRQGAYTRRSSSVFVQS